MILQAGFTKQGSEDQLEGVFLDLASVLGQQTAMRPQLCCMEPQRHTVEDAVTRRRGYVRGAGRPMIALAP
jgi:hypothetical protein